MRSTVTGYWYVGRVGNDAFLPDGIWVRDGEHYQWGARYAAFRRVGGKSADRRAFLPIDGARSLPGVFALFRSDVTALPCVGSRVEVPAHADAWMRGDRFGVVTRIGSDGTLHVTGDRGTRTRIVREDWRYARAIVGAGARAIEPEPMYGERADG